MLKKKKIKTDLKFIRKGELLNDGSIVVRIMSEENDRLDLDFGSQLHWIVKAFAKHYKPTLYVLDGIRQSFFRYFPEKEKDKDDCYFPPSLSISIQLNDNFNKALLDFDIRARKFLSEAHLLCTDTSPKIVYENIDPDVGAWLGKCKM